MLCKVTKSTMKFKLCSRRPNLVLFFKVLQVQLILKTISPCLPKGRCFNGLAKDPILNSKLRTNNWELCQGRLMSDLLIRRAKLVRRLPSILKHDSNTIQLPKIKALINTFRWVQNSNMWIKSAASKKSNRILQNKKWKIKIHGNFKERLKLEVW